MEQPKTLEELSDFLTKYTTYTVQYIDTENRLYFSADSNDFYLTLEADVFKLYKREFELSGDYSQRLESKSFNAILNSIHFLTRINSPKP